jgi:hypothetical protein
VSITRCPPKLKTTRTQEGVSLCLTGLVQQSRFNRIDSRPRLTSGCNAVCQCHASQDGTQDILHVIGAADVTGASLQRRDPQLLIRYAMGAYDGQGGEIVVQVPYIGQTRVFHIENHDLWVVPGDPFAEFIPGARHVYGMEVRRKPTGQRLGNPRIALKNDYTKAHRSS